MQNRCFEFFFGSIFDFEARNLYSKASRVDLEGARGPGNPKRCQKKQNKLKKRVFFPDDRVIHGIGGFERLDMLPQWL